MTWRTQYSPIGLDIGSHQIKMIQLKGRGKDWRVHDAAIASFADEPERGIQDGAEQTVHCLSTMFARGNFQGRKVISVLPCAEVDIRTIHVPVQEASHDIQEIIRQEAESYLPYDIEQAILDAIVAGEEGTGESLKQRFILAATRRQFVESHLRLLREAGFLCLALDVHPMALSRLLLRHLSTADAPLLVVDIGARYSSAFVLWEGLLMYNRTLPWGGAVLTQAIAKDLKLSQEKAEFLKQQYGIDPWTRVLPILTESAPSLNPKAMSGLVYEIVRPHLAYFAQELERILSYWGAQAYGAMIDRLLLSGGSAALKHFDDYLQQAIGIEVTVAKPASYLGQEIPHQSGEKLDNSCGPALATAIGLALREKARHG